MGGVGKVMLLVCDASDAPRKRESFVSARRCEPFAWHIQAHKMPRFEPLGRTKAPSSAGLRLAFGVQKVHVMPLEHGQLGRVKTIRPKPLSMACSKPLSMRT